MFGLSKAHKALWKMLVDEVITAVSEMPGDGQRLLPQEGRFSEVLIRSTF